MQKRLKGEKELGAAMIGRFRGIVLCDVEATNRCLHRNLGMFAYYLGV